MGRSVSRPPSAVTWAYTCLSDLGEEIEDQSDWDFITDAYVEELVSMFPSLSPCDVWVGREDHALAENGHAYFGLSEYCGVICYWAIPKQAYQWREYKSEAIQVHWIEQISKRFEDAFSTMWKQGTMSNGVSVYARSGD